MKLIYEIIQKLNKQELRQVKHVLKTSLFTHEKVGKLFELVTQNPEKEEAFYSQKLYNKAPDNTFRVTKSRLKRMLENIILQDKSLTGYSSKSINILLQSKKKLLQGEILLGRGAYNASKNLLFQVISNTQKYQLHNELFQAQLLMYRNRSIRTTVKDFEKNTKELLALNQLCAKVNEVSILHYSISNLLLNQTLEKNQVSDVRSTLDRMRLLTEETQHPLAQNLYLLSEIYFQLISHDFETALSFCEKYLQLIQAESSLFSKQKLGSAYVQLASVSLQLGKMENAKRYVDESLKIYEPDEMNYLVALELAFRIAYFSLAYDNAQYHIKTAFKHPQFEASQILTARWHYFQACLLFRMEKFRAAYKSLNNTSPLLADKYGNVHIRIMEIILMFECKNYDLLETKILNMRQYVKRSQKDAQLLRPNALIKILLKWYKYDFQFKKTLKQVQPLLKELHSLEEYNPILTSGFELVRLEQWFIDKSE